MSERHGVRKTNSRDIQKTSARKMSVATKTAFAIIEFLSATCPTHAAKKKAEVMPPLPKGGCGLRRVVLRNGLGVEVFAFGRCNQFLHEAGAYFFIADLDLVLALTDFL